MIIARDLRIYAFAFPQGALRFGGGRKTVPTDTFDNLVMLERVCLVAGVDAIELNLACPNIPGKPTIQQGYDV